jgi:hypothetical protein
MKNRIINLLGGYTYSDMEKIIKGYKEINREEIKTLQKVKELLTN